MQRRPINLKWIVLAVLILCLGQGLPGLAADDAATEEAPMSEECKAFAEDPNADLGEVIKAGCQPTLAQMSALMDNPLGNVAMLFTQFDVYNMTNDNFTDEDATKSVYTGIFQFPKKLTDDWNLINRVVWTVPSMPLDQDKIDSAAGAGQQQQYGEGSGSSTLPPVDKTALPINVFDGRTTGFGDMYYVGLFSPSEGMDWLNGKFLGVPASMPAFPRQARIFWAQASGPRVPPRWRSTWGRNGRSAAWCSNIGTTLVTATVTMSA